MLRTLVARATVPRSTFRAMSTLQNSCPPGPPGRNNTADLCDAYIKAPVDEVVEGNGVQIMQPGFRCVMVIDCMGD